MIPARFVWPVVVSLAVAACATHTDDDTSSASDSALSGGTHCWGNRDCERGYTGCDPTTNRCTRICDLGSSCSSPSESCVADDDAPVGYDGFCRKGSGGSAPSTSGGGSTSSARGCNRFTPCPGGQYCIPEGANGQGTCSTQASSFGGGCSSPDDCHYGLRCSPAGRCY